MSRFSSSNFTGEEGVKQDTIYVLKENTTTMNTFRIGETKSFPDRPKIKEFIMTKMALQKCYRYLKQKRP